MGALGIVIPDGICNECACKWQHRHIALSYELWPKCRLTRALTVTAAISTDGWKAIESIEVLTKFIHECFFRPVPPTIGLDCAGTIPATFFAKPALSTVDTSATDNNAQQYLSLCLGYPATLNSTMKVVALTLANNSLTGAENPLNL